MDFLKHVVSMTAEPSMTAFDCIIMCVYATSPPDPPRRRMHEHLPFGRPILIWDGRLPIGGA